MGLKTVTLARWLAKKYFDCILKINLCYLATFIHPLFIIRLFLFYSGDVPTLAKDLNFLTHSILVNIHCVWNFHNANNKKCVILNKVYHLQSSSEGVISLYCDRCNRGHVAFCHSLLIYLRNMTFWTLIHRQYCQI